MRELVQQRSVLRRYTPANPISRRASSTVQASAMAMANIAGWPAPGEYADRVVGCFLAALCADALGAAVEGWQAYRIREDFPNGLTEFQNVRMGLGCYTDDGQMLLALAASLVNHHGDCTAVQTATEYTKAFDVFRGYGGHARDAMDRLQYRLQQGPLTQAIFDGVHQELTGPPGGSFGNGGAMRVAPLALAYRNAPLPVLEAALRESLLPTNHVHPEAVEGALAQALAVAHLSKLQPTATALGGVVGTPPEGAMKLLEALQQQLQGRPEGVMHSKLQQVKEGLSQLHAQGGPKQPQQSWQDYFASDSWQLELEVANAVAPGFQIKATDAVAASIWALVAHWGQATDAIVAGVHYGGDTDTIACMTGALAGAQHGCSCLPADWVNQLEQHADIGKFSAAAVQQALGNDGGQQPQPAQGEAQLVNTTLNMGRDGAVLLARLVAQLDRTA